MVGGRARPLVQSLPLQGTPRRGLRDFRWREFGEGLRGLPPPNKHNMRPSPLPPPAIAVGTTAAGAGEGGGCRLRAPRHWRVTRVSRRMCHGSEWPKQTAGGPEVDRRMTG